MVYSSRVVPKSHDLGEVPSFMLLKKVVLFKIFFKKIILMECIHVKSPIIQLVDSLSVFNKYIKGLTLIPVLTKKVSKK